jgi:hypothetical protein
LTIVLYVPLLTIVLYVPLLTIVLYVPLLTIVLHVITYNFTCKSIIPCSPYNNKTLLKLHYKTT